jgi:hypothetical protein
MAELLGPAFLVCAALLAVWIDVRFPGLAPRSLMMRMFAVLVAVLLLVLVPLLDSSPTAAFASLFAFLLPTLVFTFLTAVWLLRALAESPQHL